MDDCDGRSVQAIGGWRGGILSFGWWWLTSDLVVMVIVGVGVVEASASVIARRRVGRHGGRGPTSIGPVQGDRRLENVLLIA